MSVDIVDYNRPDGEPPYALQNPASGGHVKWICSADQRGTYVSVLANDDPDFDDNTGVPAKIITEHKTIEEVKETRDAFIEGGWLPIKLPEIQFTDSDGNVISKNKKILSRKEQRFLAKQLRKSSNFQKSLVGKK